MNQKDEDIQRQLNKLEIEVLKEEEPHSVSFENKSSTNVTVGQNADIVSGASVQQDLYYFSGLGLIITGILMFFNHVHVGTGFFQMLGLGGGGFGLLLIPLMVCLGWLMYDYKNKIAWIATAIMCGVVIFSILSSLVMTFPGMTLLGMIMLLLPFAAGGALLLKGAGGASGLKEKMSK